MYNGGGYRGAASGHIPPGTTVVRSCTEFSHERSSHSSSSCYAGPVVSKLLIQPAHLKAQSISRWPSPTGRNPGVTLLHASDHVSIMPVRTIPAGKLKQLIASPHLASHPCAAITTTTINSSSSQPVVNGTGTTTASSSSSSAPMMPSPPLPHHQRQQQSFPKHQTRRPLRVAQPPHPFTPGPPAVPSTSFPSSSQHLPNSISVPTLHSRNKADSPSSDPFFTRSAASAVALGECFDRFSHEELLDLARNQQSQIEINEAELDERRKAVALFGVARRTAGSETEQQENAKMLMANLQAQIEREERELAQLSQCQKEARQLREINQNENRQLGQLETEYSQYEQQLRGSVQKVDSLRNQLETMYQRRAAAADAAVAKQRQINNNNNNGWGAEGGRKMPAAAERRPKASVSPFKSENIDRDEADCAASLLAAKAPPLPPSSHQQQQHHSSASIQTVQWRRDCMPANEGGGGGYPPHHAHHGALPPAVDKISLRRNSINQAKRNSLISDSGDDPHILALMLAEQRRGRTHISFGRSWDGLGQGAGLVANAKANLGFLNGNNKEDGHIIDDGKKGQKEEAMGQNKQMEESAQKRQKQNGGPSPVKKTLGMPPQQENSLVDMFNKTFDQQTTRRAEEEEGEERRREMEDAKKQEEEEETGEEDGEKEEEEKTGEEDDEKEEEEMEGREKREDQQEEEQQQRENPEKPPVEKEEGEEEERGDMLEDIQLNLDADLEKFDQVEMDENGAGNEPGEQPEHPVNGGSPTNSSSSAESEEKEEVQFDKSWQYQRPPGVEGILRRKNDKNGPERGRRRVKFDLVVLFLDVAYEGQYEALVELASKIDNISVANSEGITALHYAICASNHDIANFLVDHEADVNALDVDGWSPLHCAASCNNLPMLRLLIDNGACPFATTISKSETPSQIFDESSDYAAGAEYMEMIERCMGEVDEGKVYAAYSYEAEHGDELDFEEGDQLRVLRKCEGDEMRRAPEEEGSSDSGEEEEGEEQMWWLCESCSTGQKGLVPRNYLALFPIRKHRSRYQINFQLPSQPQTTTMMGVENGGAEGQQRGDDIVDDDEDGQQIGVLSVQNSKPLGHQELSTYA